MTGSIALKTEAETVLTVRPSAPQGRVCLSGAKNSALRLAVASLLTSEPVTLQRFPSGLLDVGVQLGMLERLGKGVAKGGDWATMTQESDPGSTLVWEGRSIRNTLLVLGALLARTGEARVPLPGGCDLGGRPYDLHQELLEALGARVWEESGFLCARHPGGRLQPGRYVSPVRSTGVTENALLCGALIPGGVELVNPHLTPEVMDLIGLLRRMGVRVDINGSHSIVVRGADELGGTSWTVIPDRVEGVTWAAAAIIGRGDIEISDFPFDAAAVALEYLRVAGARLFRGEDGLIVRSEGPQPIALSVGSHPGVHSDMHPLFGVIGSLASGRTEIVDLRYPERFAYLEELAKLGAVCSSSYGRATIDGTGRLGGGTVTTPDLRAGAALMLAGLAADGPVTLLDAWQVLRGYDRLDDKLSTLGVRATWAS